MATCVGRSVRADRHDSGRVRLDVQDRCREETGGIKVMTRVRCRGDTGGIKEMTCVGGVARVGRLFGAAGGRRCQS